MPIKNQINREARGFLDMLRAKVGGQGPQTFNDGVQPVIDLSAFYAGPLVASQTTGTTGGSGASVTVTVPSDETWLVHNINGYFYDQNIPRDFNSAARLSLTNLAVGASHVLRTGWITNYQADAAETADQTLDLSWQPPGNFLLGPGVNIVLTVTDSRYTGTLSVSCLYSLLNV